MVTGTEYEPTITTSSSGEVVFVPPLEEIMPDIPVQPLLWKLLIQPYVPSKNAGVIEMTDDAVESESLLTYIGRIVAMGSQCYKMKTRSGIDLAEETNMPKVGDWVVYGTYGGQTLRMKDGRKYLLLNDDGILAKVYDPSAFKFYY